MASDYRWGFNPIQDLLMKTIMMDADISDADMKGELNNVFTYILENYMRNKGDMVYLDFNIIKDDNYFKLVGNNILTALWLSGIMPDNPRKVLEKNICNVENRKYVFDVKTKLLTYTIVDE